MGLKCFFLHGPEEVSYGGATVKKRLGQFLLQVPIPIPYIVRIIQANIKIWTTILIMRKMPRKGTL